MGMWRNCFTDYVWSVPDQTFNQSTHVCVCVNPINELFFNRHFHMTLIAQICHSLRSRPCHCCHCHESILSNPKTDHEKSKQLHTHLGPHQSLSNGKRLRKLNGARNINWVHIVHPLGKMFWIIYVLLAVNRNEYKMEKDPHRFRAQSIGFSAHHEHHNLNLNVIAKKLDLLQGENKQNENHGNEENQHFEEALPSNEKHTN